MAQEALPDLPGCVLQISGHVYAVDGVSFSIGRGETLGLVGRERLAGQVDGRAHAAAPARTTAGTVKIGGEDITISRGEQLLPYRRRMQMIYQDPLRLA
jgi:ABC-type microcin C transport system duplicated ATPase subunit YejF